MLKQSEVFDYLGKQLERELARLEISYILQKRVMKALYKAVENTLIKYYDG